MAPASSSNTAKVTALQAQLSQVQQQLAQHAQQMASRHQAQQQRFDQLVADQSELKQQLFQLVTTSQSKLGTAAGTGSVISCCESSDMGQIEPVKRARAADGSVSPLDEDDVLDAVFSYVGIREYVYIAGVSRRWRGRYIKLCYNSVKSTRGRKTDKLRTSHGSAARTAARLQLAFDSGLTVANLQEHQYMCASAMVLHSLEPMAALTLARLYGLQWTDDYVRCAVQRNDLALLQWLHKCGCPFTFKNAAYWAALFNSVDVLKWCHSESDVLSHHTQRLLCCAGEYASFACLEWLRAQGADWPAAFYSTRKGACWAVPAVQWALRHGCVWGVWRCEDFTPGNRNFICVCISSSSEPYQGCAAPHCGEQAAADLFAWAHENGCPCSCNCSTSPRSSVSDNDSSDE
jgi:hypothetical protein